LRRQSRPDGKAEYAASIEEEADDGDVATVLVEIE